MRFAGDDQVIVRQRYSKIFLANPTKVAVECGFYDVPDAHGEKSSQRQEHMQRTTRLLGQGRPQAKLEDLAGRAQLVGCPWRVDSAVINLHFSGRWIGLSAPY